MTLKEKFLFVIILVVKELILKKVPEITIKKSTRMKHLFAIFVGKDFVMSVI